MTFVQSNLGSVASLYGFAFDGTSQSLAAIIQQRENARINQIKQFWNYYHGKHYDYTRADGDLPYVNLCYGVVEKSISWLVGQPPKIKFRADIQPIIQEIYDEILQNSGGPSFFYDAAQMGAVTGDCVIQIGFDTEVNYGQGGITMKVLSSDRCFLEYTNEGNRKFLSKVMISWDEIDQVTGEVVNYTEIWTPELIYVFPRNVSLSIRSLSSMFKEGDVKDYGDYRTFPNPYGELPFVHIPNLRLSNNVYGRSDLHDLWIMNKEMNESLVSYKDNVNYHGNPLTLLYGISLKNIEKGANKVWGNLPKDGRVENLKVESLYSDITQYLQLLEKYAGMVGIPTHLMNLEQQMWADTSQAGMRLAFLPLVELTNRKRITYGLGFKQAVEKAIKYTNTFFNLQLEQLNKPDPRTVKKLADSPLAAFPKSLDAILQMRMKPYFECEVIFEESLPRNRTLELTDIDMELRNKLESVRGAMERLGIVDPDKKMEDIIADQNWIASLDSLYAVASQPPTPESQLDAEEANLSAQEAVPGSDAQKQAQERDAGTTETDTGQPTERTATQKATKGKGGV